MKIKIYLIKNKINGMMYVGKTSRKLHERWREHANKASVRRMRHNTLSEDIQKFGKESFELSLLCECDSKENGNIMEEYWINRLDTLNTGYNKKHGGDTGKHIQETIEKIAESSRNRVLSEESLEKLRRSNSVPRPWTRGIPKSEEHKRKISLSQKHRIIDEHTAIRIKEMLSKNIKSVDIAKHFDIPVCIVYNIKYGKSWKTI